MIEISHVLTYLSAERVAVVIAVLLGGLVCLSFMVWRTSLWKRRHHELSIRCASLEERLALEQEHAEQKVALLERAGKELRHEFKILAQEIFDEKTALFSSQSSEKMEGLLTPLREQLHSFRGRIETIFLEESREQSSLKQEILHLRELNRQISDEAVNLTRAISGNQKQQGAWGEFILEKILAQSGLREGREFTAQAGYRDQDNNLLKPDIIIHLPGDRDIVIDSKVSLVAWARYTGEERDEEREAALNAHIISLRSHLKSLGDKDYSSLKGLRSLDFVLMFVPIDAAFMTALQAKEELLDEMISRKVLVVTPTTLLATLKTIEYYWQVDRQNDNAREIADRAAAMYDKLRGFLEDMERLGKQLDTCRDSYDKALNKLSQGRGNLVSQAARFTELGVKVKTELPKGLGVQTPEETNNVSTP